jgi:hypothetical protein
MNILVELLLVYLLYRFIAGFIIPLFRASRQMRQQFQDMNRQANGQTGNHTTNGTGQTKPPGTPESGSSKLGEYIDFEEVKSKA